jgi:hypothetical protein
MPPNVKTKIMPDTVKALMAHSAASAAGTSSFQPSSDSSVEALVASAGWIYRPLEILG